MTTLLTRLRATDMIIDNDPAITRSISVPREMSQLSCSSFTAGMVEAVLDGLGFVRHTATPQISSSLTLHAACTRNGTQYTKH